MPSPCIVKEYPWIIWLLRTLHQDAKDSSSITDNELIHNATSYLSITNSAQWIISERWVKEIPSNITPESDLATPKQCALFLFAMGELAAWCNETPTEKCKILVSKSPCFNQLNLIWSEIGALASTYYPDQFTSDRDSEKLTKIITTASVDVDTYEYIDDLLRHPLRPSIERRYGLALGSRIISELDYEQFGNWLMTQTDPSIICPATYRLFDHMIFWKKGQIASALRSKHPFLNCLGLYSMHCMKNNDETGDWKFTVKEAIQLADTSNIDRSNSIWTSFKRLVDISILIAQLVSRLESARFNQQSNICEIEATRLDFLHSSLEQSLDETAKFYPPKGLSEEKVYNIMKLSRTNNTLPVKLALCLPATANKTLLKAIYRKFERQSQLSADITDTAFSLSPSWHHEMDHAATAFVHFYQNENIGYKYGTRVSTIQKELTKISSQPFLFNRNFNLWTQTFGRLAFIHLYALKISALGEQFDPEGAKFLQDYASSASLKLMQYYRGETFHRLFLTLADATGDIALQDLSKLIESPLCYHLIKLHFILTDVEYFKKYKALSLLLFKEEHTPKTILDNNFVFNRLLTCLDKMICYSFQLNDYEFIDEIIATWNMTPLQWANISIDESGCIAAKIYDALQGKKDELAWIATAPEFQLSATRKHCRQLFPDEFNSLNFNNKTHLLK